MKMPWLDREICAVAEVGEGCKAARYCPHGAFQVVKENEGKEVTYKIAIDLEACRFCGDCEHACVLNAVKMM